MRSGGFVNTQLQSFLQRTNALHPYILLNGTKKTCFVTENCPAVPIRYRSSHVVDKTEPKTETASHHRLIRKDDAAQIFQTRRAVIFTKMTRFEYERKLCERMSELEFREYVSQNSFKEYERIITCTI